MSVKSGGTDRMLKVQKKLVSGQMNKAMPSTMKVAGDKEWSILKELQIQGPVAFQLFRYDAEVT